MSSVATKTGEPIEQPEPGDEIRAFPHAGIRGAIETAVAAIPEGKHFAVVGFYDLTHRARFAAYARGDGAWSFAGVLEHAPRAGWKGEAAVMWSK